MKKIVFFLFAFLVLIGCRKDIFQPEIEDVPPGYISRFFGGSHDAFGVSILPADSNFYILGTSYNIFDDDTSDIILGIVNKAGEIVSAFQNAGLRGSSAKMMIPTENHGLAIIGDWVDNFNRRGIVLLLVDEEGTMDTVASFFNPNGDYKSEAIIECNTGGFLICGIATDNASGKDSVFVLRTNQIGLKNWDNSFNAGNSVIGIAETTNENFFISGISQTDSIVDKEYYFLLNLGGGGEIMGNIFFGDFSNRDPGAMYVSGNTFFVCGTAHTPDRKPEVFRVSSQGLASEITVPYSGEASIQNIIEIPGGNLLAIGTAKMKNAQRNEFWVNEFTQTGDPVADWTFGGIGNENGSSICNVNGNTIAAVGSTEYLSHSMMMFISYNR